MKLDNQIQYNTLKDDINSAIINAQFENLAEISINESKLYKINTELNQYTFFKEKDFFNLKESQFYSKLYSERPIVESKINPNQFSVRNPFENSFELKKSNNLSFSDPNENLLKTNLNQIFPIQSSKRDQLNLLNTENYKSNCN